MLYSGFFFALLKLSRAGEVEVSLVELAVTV